MSSPTFLGDCSVSTSVRRLSGPPSGSDYRAAATRRRKQRDEKRTWRSSIRNSPHIPSCPVPKSMSRAAATRMSRGVDSVPTHETKGTDLGGKSRRGTNLTTSGTEVDDLLVEMQISECRFKSRSRYSSTVVQRVENRREIESTGQHVFHVSIISSRNRGLRVVLRRSTLRSVLPTNLEVLGSASSNAHLNLLQLSAIHSTMSPAPCARPHVPRGRT